MIMTNCIQMLIPYIHHQNMVELNSTKELPILINVNVANHKLVF